MAAGEDEPEPVVLDVVWLGGFVGRRRELVGDVGQRRVEPRAPTNGIDRLEPAGGHEPCARIGGDTIPRPALHGRREGIVQRLLGEIEVAEEADQRREDAA